MILVDLHFGLDQWINWNRIETAPPFGPGLGRRNEAQDTVGPILLYQSDKSTEESYVIRSSSHHSLENAGVLCM